MGTTTFQPLCRKQKSPCRLPFTKYGTVGDVVLHVSKATDSVWTLRAYIATPLFQLWQGRSLLRRMHRSKFARSWKHER